MKIFAGLLAVGVLCLEVPHNSHAAINCVPLAQGTGGFQCTETDVGEALYTWSSNPPGGVVQVTSPSFVIRLLDAGVNVSQWWMEHPEWTADWVAFNVCAFRHDSAAALPTETIRVEVYYGPNDPRNHTDTANINCGQAEARNDELWALWYQWEFNVLYYMALNFPGQYIDSWCYFYGTPFSCRSGTEWDAYGVTMWMYGWLNYQW